MPLKAMILKANASFLSILSKINKRLKIGIIWKPKKDQTHLGKDEFDCNFGGFIPK